MLVLNNPARDSATHRDGATNGGETLNGAREGRPEGRHNEIDPRGTPSGPLARRFRNGVMQFARQLWRATNRFTLALFETIAARSPNRRADRKLVRMTLAVIHTRALVGLHAPDVVVEVHLANGLPSFTLVGLADTEVKEARERVRAALAQSGFAFPHNKRITVNLAPADLPKESGRFDLPIALGVLAAQGLLDAKRLARCEFAGELSLAGELRPVRGALALALAVRESGCARRLVLPAASAAEAARVEGVDVRSARSLGDVVQAFLPGDGAPDLPGPTPESDGAPPPLPDLADVKGQAGARRALEVAAAGAHGLLLIGPPGAGKSMLADRLAGLLPPMTPTEALASAALLSVSTQGLDARRFGQRPVRSPHHSASAVALVGGGVRTLLKCN